MVDTDQAQKVDYSAIYMLFPGHSLEDFPTHMTGAAAAELLTTASLAWHPYLLAKSKSLPQWHRCDAYPHPFEGAFLLVPEFCRDRLPRELPDLPPEGTTPRVYPDPPFHAIHCGANRAESLKQLNALLVNPQTNLPHFTETSPCRLNDFFALGYATLQTLLLTKQLRYTCQLDFAKLADEVKTAVSMALSGDDSATHTALDRCFDLLLEEKNRYYPTAAHLLDLGVIPSKISLSEVGKQLAVDHKINLLVTGEQLERWHQELPNESQSTFENIDPQMQCLLGGIWQEHPEQLMPFAAWLLQWEAGQNAFRQSLSTPPSVYARLRGILHAGWPQLLREWNYTGALHCSFSGRALPRSSFDYVEWQSASLDSIPALTRAPLDANAAETYLQLAIRCGEQIDASHQATAILAHQVNRYCDWFQDLRIVCSYGELLGRWATASEILESMYNPGYSDTFKYDDYREDSLADETRRSQFSMTSDWRQYWINAQKINHLQRLHFMVPCISGRTPKYSPNWTNLSLHNDRLAFQTDERALESNRELPGDLQQMAVFLDQLGEQLVRTIRELLQSRFRFKAAANGWLLINSSASGRQCHWGQVHPVFSEFNEAKSTVEVVAEPVTEPVAEPAREFANSNSQDTLTTIEPLTDQRIEIPSLGFALIPGVPASNPSIKDTRAAMVWQQGLRNEFFEVEIDPISGGIRAVRYYQKRGNLVSQRLTACRESDTSAISWRSLDHRLEQPSAQYATSTTRGELWQSNQCLAIYEQQITIGRGSRLIEVRGTVTPQIKLAGSPWRNYFASQIAWNDDTSPRYREIHDQRQSLQLQRFSAPQVIEIEDTLASIALMTRGHYWHRQTSERFLDTLLAIPGDSETQFEFSLALDQPYALPTAIAQQSDIYAIPMPMGTDRSAFRFVEVAPNSIYLMRINPNYDDGGRFQGADVWLRETEGRYCDVCLSAPRILKSAWRLSLAGELIQSLPVQEDRVRFELQPFGITRIQWQW